MVNNKVILVLLSATTIVGCNSYDPTIDVLNKCGKNDEVTVTATKSSFGNSVSVSCRFIKGNNVND